MESSVQDFPLGSVLPDKTPASAETAEAPQAAAPPETAETAISAKALLIETGSDKKYMK